MNNKYNGMPRRTITADWSGALGAVDMRGHSFGIGGVHSMPAPKSVVNAAAALKPALIRIFLQEFFNIYPDHGVFDWAKLDAYMDAVHAMGGGIMASICIKPSVLYPEVDERVWKPDNVGEWQQVIKALVLRYGKEKPYVTHWAVANEMNIGEWGGCPYLITDPDEFFEYYRMTAEPIRAALPDVKIGGPSYAGNGPGAAKYLARFVELCAKNGVPVDFTCYNAYEDDPAAHAAGCRAIREALDKFDRRIGLYMTEFNLSISNELSLEESAYDPKRAAGLAAAILELYEGGCLDGSFQYHLYDQWNDPREFVRFFARSRYMAEHWNDIPHRFGLLDLNGEPRPQYFLYEMLYEIGGERAALTGTDGILRGLATRSLTGALSVFLTNYAVTGAPDAVSQIRFAYAPEGVYELTVRRIEGRGAPAVAERRTVYVHGDFHFDVYTPADTVTLIRLLPV